MNKTITSGSGANARATITKVGLSFELDTPLREQVDMAFAELDQTPRDYSQKTDKQLLQEVLLRNHALALALKGYV